MSGASGSWSPSSVALATNGLGAAAYSLSTSTSTTAGTYSLAIKTSSGSLIQNANVVVVVASPPTVNIDPGQVTLSEDVTHTFTATVSDGSGVNWSVQEGPSGGAISGTGIYTAPSATGTFHVVATSATDNAVKQTAIVIVTTTPQDFKTIGRGRLEAKPHMLLRSMGRKVLPRPPNDPGNRDNPTFWTDANGNPLALWRCQRNWLPLYTPYFNDLWSFNTTTNQWTWVSGTNVPNALGIYGTQGVAAPSNVPGARRVAASWVDTSGNFWIF